jgi:hypothetical protein
MEMVRYCTPEWLKENAQRYPLVPKFQHELAKLTLNVCFRITAEPAWGIEKDILFGAFLEKGQLIRLTFISEEEARQRAEFIMAATPQEWKRILRKENKFLTDFMLGKISLELGSKVGVLAIAPHANTFVDVLTQIALQFPDEMSPEELETYRTYAKDFREKLGV